MTCTLSPTDLDVKSHCSESDDNCSHLKQKDNPTRFLNSNIQNIDSDDTDTDVSDCNKTVSDMSDDNNHNNNDKNHNYDDDATISEESMDDVEINNADTDNRDLEETRRVEASLQIISKLSDSIARKQPLQRSLELLCGKTDDGEDHTTGCKMHKACVCVVCDRLIKGTAPVRYLKKQDLLRNENVLSVTFFNSTTGIPISEMLRNQYKLDDPYLNALLLSPRSGNTYDGYMCCQQCYDVLIKKSIKTKPPKYAISNGNAIGYVPAWVVEEITEILSALVARIQILSYVFNYYGGAHKAIKGSHMFFINDPEYIGASFQHLVESTKSKVYTMITGRMTVNQRQIVRQRCEVDTEDYKKLLNFFIENHPSYADMQPPESSPSPVIIGGFESNDNNEDAEEDPSVENNIECSTFRFAPRTQSTENTGPYSNESDFLVSKLKDKDIDFTLLFKYGTRIQSHLTKLQDMFPVQFPFGRGAVDEIRAVNISKKELFRYYTSLSLPQMMRADFILVICSIYQSLECYSRAIINCRSPFNSSTVGDEVSKLSLEQLTQATKSVLDGVQPANRSVQQLFSSVRGSCSSVGQSNEAAKVARKKYFSLWHMFGSPSVFFTVSPCDECSFRVRIYANTHDSHVLPTNGQILDVEDCLLDLQFRKKTRSTYPGACAHEFESVMQVVKEVLIGWKDGQGSNGIFGVPLAYADSVEEQMRYTLHSHICVWIKHFNQVRNLMFDENMIIKQAARAEMLKYCKLAGQATFGNLDIYIPESESDPSVNPSGNFNNIQCNPNQVFLGSEPSKQTIRNMRHFKHAAEEKGIIASIPASQDDYDSDATIMDDMSQDGTTSNDKAFTGPDLVSLNTKKAMNDVSNEFVKNNAQLDRLTYTMPYDMFSDVRCRPVDCQPCLSTFMFDGNNVHRDIAERMKQFNMRYPLLQLRVNSHDFLHRKGCFKKGCECRFLLPKGHEFLAYILFDDEDAVEWHFIDGSTKKYSRYEYMAKRNTGDQFMNMSNDIASCVLGCNTNVGLADRVQFFYVTMYASKQNQKEEKIAYLACCEGLSRRVKRQQEEAAAAATENISANQQSHQSAPVQEEQSDFAEGFKRILSAMYAHMSNDVIAATMAHLLIQQNGSRFTFSHEFVTIPLGHLVAWFDGENLQFRLRILKDVWNQDSGADDSAVHQRYAEYFIHHYIYRPNELEQYSCYELFSHFQLKKISPNRIKRGSDSSDIGCFRLHRDHPGYKYFVMERSRTMLVPQITSTKLFEDVKHLQVCVPTSEVHSDTTYYRERYATLALLLFAPYRCKEDLVMDNSTWKHYYHMLSNNLLSPRNQHVLQNIQDVQYNVIANPRKHIDPILKSTVYKRHEEDNEMRQKDQTDSDVLNYDEIQNVFHTFSADTGYEPNNNVRNLMYTVANHNVPADKVNVTGCIQGLRDVLTIPPDVQQTVGDDETDGEHIPWDPQQYENTEHLIIEYVAYGILSQSLFDDDDSDIGGIAFNCDDINMATYADKHLGTDLIQIAAFEVMACSFLLRQLDKHGINELGIAKLFPNIEMRQSKTEKLNVLIDLLKQKGGLDDLFMFLSGMGGSGKSKVINAFKSYSKVVCSNLNWHYDFDTVKICALTGAAAALLPEGRTVHGAAQLNKETKNITDDDRQKWENAQVLIIDEVSFMSCATLDNLDKKLKSLRQNSKRFGDVIVILVGDFHQLNPVHGCPLYRGNNVLVQAINRAVFLNRSHRFEQDPQFGAVMRRFRNGTVTVQDLEWINERCIDNETVTLPSYDTIRYACAENTHRNAISNALFSKHLQETHVKSVDSSVACPGHTCIIKATMKQSKRTTRMIPQSLQNLIFDTVGDAYMRNNETTKVDPALKFYHNKPLMLTSNKQIEERLANGTPCRGMYLKLKDGVSFQKECWDGYMVNTVYAHEVDHMICMHERTDMRDPVVYFKIEPVSLAVQITMPTMNNFKFRGITATQFGVNDNIATTCHKLQGVSMDSLVIDSFNYRMTNWIYVVLSRVKTRNGLVLCEKLNTDRSYEVNKQLLEWESKMQDKHEVELFKLRSQLNEYVHERELVENEIVHQ